MSWNYHLGNSSWGTYKMIYPLKFNVARTLALGSAMAKADFTDTNTCSSRGTSRSCYCEFKNDSVLIQTFNSVYIIVLGTI